MIKDYQLEFEVRDYEVDLLGIVNNSVYQNYLEHARHKFLKENSIDFHEVAKRGIHLVILRVEIDYKTPLRSGDQFTVSTKMERVSRAKFKFVQDIHRNPDNKVIINANVFGTALNARGRPCVPDEFEPLIEQFETTSS